MNRSECENVMYAALARMDGEQPQLCEKETLDHLANCQSCRDELAELTSVLQPLNEQKRRVFSHDLWSDVEAALVSPAQALPDYKYIVMFSIFGMILLVAKVLEVSPGIAPGPMIKLISIVVTIVFFCLLKQNPFQIREDLMLSHRQAPLTQDKPKELL